MGVKEPLVALAGISHQDEGTARAQFQATLYAYIDDASGQWVVSEITSFAEKGLI